MKNRIFEKLLPNGHNDGPETATAEGPQLDMQTIKDGLSDVTTFVHEHPAACLGAAFTVGILLGWMVKRS
jgi:ElaB/YqjD/DUF883 family membrane-anchored ribosome-binding protein